MAPQRNWTEFCTQLAAKVNKYTPQLTRAEQDALSRKFIKITQHHQAYKNVDHMIDDYAKVLMSLNADLEIKATLLNAILGLVRDFLQIEPLRHTFGTD